MAHDVFISYSNKDKAIADAVCASLEVTGIRVWIAHRDTRPGAEWEEAIGDGLAGRQTLDCLSTYFAVLARLDDPVKFGPGVPRGGRR